VNRRRRRRGRERVCDRRRADRIGEPAGTRSRIRTSSSTPRRRPTSVVLAVERPSTRTPRAASCRRGSAWECPGASPSERAGRRYVVLAAFENDDLVRTRPEHRGKQIVHISGSGAAASHPTLQDHRALADGRPRRGRAGGGGLPHADAGMGDTPARTATTCSYYDLWQHVVEHDRRRRCRAAPRVPGSTRARRWRRAGTTSSRRFRSRARTTYATEVPGRLLLQPR
jgi:hypothetical protein